MRHIVTQDIDKPVDLLSHPKSKDADKHIQTVILTQVSNVLLVVLLYACVYLWFEYVCLENV